MTRGQPTLICKALASHAQLQWRYAAGPVCSTKTEAGCLGLVHFCSRLLFPISCASCFASFIHAPNLGIARTPQHSATPTVATQFTKDKERRSVSSFQWCCNHCCNSFKITRFLLSRVSKHHCCKTPPQIFCGRHLLLPLRRSLLHPPHFYLPVAFILGCFCCVCFWIAFSCCQLSSHLCETNQWGTF